MFILTALASYGVYQWSSQGEGAQFTPNRTEPDLALNRGSDADNAENILDNWLAAPSTSHYVSANTVASQGEWRMVHVVVDAQNSFGAMLRKSLCVTFFYEGKRLRWHETFGVQECGKPPTGDEIAGIKVLNNWPK